MKKIWMLYNKKKNLKKNNLDHLTVDSNPGKISKHGKILPCTRTVRCIISGSSNVGKTNVAFNLLTKPISVHFNNVYVFSKSLNQPKYQLLEKILSDIPEISYFINNANDEIMEPDNTNPTQCLCLIMFCVKTMI